MRKYKDSDGRIVDLDNPSTYKMYLDNAREVEKMIFSEIGRALVYMNCSSRSPHFPKRKLKPNMQYLEWGTKDKIGRTRWHRSKQKVDLNNLGWQQRQRVYKLMQQFADGRHQNYDNVRWMQEQLFLLQDECENMC